MPTLFHLSDIHFGAEDRAALDWFAATVHAERPDAIIMTGDLTMRARSDEFRAACEWLRDLDTPMTVEAGNHDLPLFNPIRRFTRPYGRYQALKRVIERPLDIANLLVVPLKTTARFQWRRDWSKGRVSVSGLARALATIATTPKGTTILVAAHHPLVEAGTRGTARTHGGKAALAALARAGAHAVLTGHVHDPFDRNVEAGGHSIRTIGAGTLSVRTRASRPSFNAITVEGGAIAVTPRVMEPLGDRDPPR